MLSFSHGEISKWIWWQNQWDCLYGEDVSTYKDMQDMDYLLKKIGYNDNPERAIYLFELVLKAITKPSSHNSQRKDSSSSINGPIFRFKSISKEIQHQKLAEIIENIRLHYHQNDLKWLRSVRKLSQWQISLTRKKQYYGNSFTCLKTNKSPLTSSSTK